MNCLQCGKKTNFNVVKKSYNSFCSLFCTNEYTHNISLKKKESELQEIYQQTQKLQKTTLQEKGIYFNQYTSMTLSVYYSQDKYNYKKFYDHVIIKLGITSNKLLHSIVLYHTIKNDFIIPSCEVCGSNVEFIDKYKGYRRFCSTLCTRASVELKEETKQKNLEKFGVENPMQLHEFQKKQQESLFQSYGVYSPMKSKELQSKRSHNNLIKHGVPNSSQMKVSKETIKNNKIKEYQKLVGEDYVIKDYVCSSQEKETYSKLTLEHKTCGNISEYEVGLGYRGRREYNLCHFCTPKKTVGSLLESIIEIFLSENDIEYESHYKLYNQNHKNKKDYKELDFYIPNKKLAIEVNGVYWHGVNFVGKGYHQQKTLFIRNHGIDVFQIYEDDLLTKKNLVLSRLKEKLELTKKVDISNLTFNKISNLESNQFLERNHLLGVDVNDFSFGYYEKEDLLFVITLKQIENNKVLEISRIGFKNGISISGLEKNFLKDLRTNEYIMGFESIQGYSDLGNSDSGIYKSLGFTLLKETEPNIYYTKGFQREKTGSSNGEELITQGFWQIEDSGFELWTLVL